MFIINLNIMKNNNYNLTKIFILFIKEKKKDKIYNNALILIINIFGLIF
jgi:hypothetical protein